MAVLDELQGIEVAICVDEQRAHEYLDEEFHAKPHLNTVCSYIESETLKEFAVKIVVKEPFVPNCPTLSFQIIVDGVKVREPLLTQKAFENCSRNWETCWAGVKYQSEEHDCILRPFRFSKIDTSTDDEQLDSLQSDIKSMDKLGDIVVKVLRRTETKFVGWKFEQESLLNGHPSTVHEKALKGQAKSHSASLGDGRASGLSRKLESELIDGEDNPIAIFRFKYRSKEALEALLVIRKSPEPEPEPEQAQLSRTATPEPINIDVATLTPAARRQLEEFYQILQSGTVAPMPQVKQEAKDFVKRERESGETDEAAEAVEAIRSRKKCRKQTTRASIDLTLD